MGHSVEKQVIKELKLYWYRAEYLDHIDFP